ncbi:MAG: bacteriophage holin [Nanoarchaeota archaeon]|nr:bacteriophage holin [Nanoarchaeota archaeon]
MAKKEIVKAKGPLPVRAGVAFGILWGAVMALMALFAMIGYGAEWVSDWGMLYIGYSASVVGTVLGAVYGFFDGFIGAFIVVWLYNKLNINK